MTMSGGRGLRAILCVLAICACGATSSEEKRCSELGDYCLCSEPLDNDDVYLPHHDPSDSTTKECGVMDAARGGIGTSDLPVRLSPSAKTRYAFKIENDGWSNGWLSYRFPSDPLDVTGKTLCVRHYALYGRGRKPANIKIARIGHPDGTAWQSAWNGPPQLSVIGTLGAPRNYVDCNIPVVDPSNLVEFDDCQDHWCRFEICAEHDPKTGEHMFRARWTQVGGAHSHESRGNCGAQPSPRSWIVGGSAAVLEYTTEPGAAGGSRYLSHAMLVLRPYDPNFWIGAACEVEGGCS